MMEIKGKSFPGRDGVFALKMPDNPPLLHPGRSYETPPSVVDYHDSTIFYTERFRPTKNALDRVKKRMQYQIQDRIQDRIQERRDRFEGTPLDLKHEGVLKVSDRSFCQNGCEALLRVIKNQDKKLVELDLSGCNIYKGDDLAQIVRSVTSLKRLSLEWNSLGLARTGIAALSSAIASSPSLKEVDLRSNRIGPSTIAPLAHALQSNSSLSCLDLRWNEIGPGGATTIVAMLQRNHCLTDIHLVGNGIPLSTQAQIDELLEKNRTSKLSKPNGPHLDDHESYIGLNPNDRPIKIADINLEQISSLQKEIDNLRQGLESCKAELCEVQLQKVASDTQLETIQEELKEEKLLRKFIEKETNDFKSHVDFSKQSEVMEAREMAHQAQIAEVEARKENKHLKENMVKAQAENKARVDAIQERTKNYINYTSSIINRLEAEMTQQKLKHKEEVDSIHAKFITQIKNLENAKDNAVREFEKQKCVILRYETQLATKEQCFQNDKEVAQKVFDGKMNSMKLEITTLKDQLESNNLEQQKLKKKNASIVEDYENQITHLTSSITKIEAIKSGIEEEMMLMTAEQKKSNEKIKNGDAKHREMELRIESDRVKHAQALAHEVAKHLEDRRSLETELAVTRRQIEVVHLHVKEIQSEQERRKFDTERRVTGTETAVLEWVHQQFASLKSALIVQHSVASIG